MKKYFILIEDDEVKLVSQNYNHVKRFSKNKESKFYRLKTPDDFSVFFQDYFDKSFWLEGKIQRKMEFEIPTPDSLKNKIGSSYTFEFKSE